MIQDVGKLAIEMTQEMEKVLKKRYKDLEELRDLVRKALPKTLLKRLKKFRAKSARLRRSSRRKWKAELIFPRRCSRFPASSRTR